MKRLLDNLHKAPISSLIGILIILITIFLYSYGKMSENVLIFLAGGAYGLFKDPFKEARQIDNNNESL